MAKSKIFQVQQCAILLLLKATDTFYIYIFIGNILNNILSIKPLLLNKLIYYLLYKRDLA